MKIVIQLQGENILSFMRRAGYGFQKEGSGEVAFIRRAGQSPFPRFHVYASEADSRKPIADSTKAIVINLHIDQKQPTYGSGHAHSGEYEGSAIVAELNRLHALAQVKKEQPAGEDEKPAQGGSASGGKGFFGKLFG